MAQLRMQTQVPGAKMDSRYPADSVLLGDMKQVRNVRWELNTFASSIFNDRIQKVTTFDQFSPTVFTGFEKCRNFYIVNFSLSNIQALPYIT